MFGFIKKILGSKSDKDLKDLYPLVDDINLKFDKLKNISDDELRNKTFEFKEIIQNNLKDSNQVIDSLREKYKKSFFDNEGQRITFTPLFIDAVVKSLKDYPI